ncbi:MAG: nicotinate (nicotinamide) nucleotide adenylyltransferase [Gracilimonas sp.]|uniref:nicotinate (nicotinamide) nucleotide adenylyltransferase n=1 Tax=Gracilimonas TaxID=649462 RepID=UPI001B1AAEEA|nr:nicotinate (nicotinamide) nucleotide adenylyltransferase [Gracilimonas sp.]MBO6586394.1 nicotinate (nicotinamide) nucleotide adenylyltransferase [Gracilimonas sp.]MBO6615051.1 nicotinate (nicotinamide) nucleotide adenylyltransferase [Gracilimonas sp.]
MSGRIGLFGGTFDPVHNGHISIAQSFLQSDLIDELWVLLTPYPPHKTREIQTPYEIRLEMLEKAFSGIRNLSIKTIENELPKPSYSVQTIRYLKEHLPDNTYFYCMGEDSLAKFHTWKYYEEILDECELLVAQRPGETHKDVEDKILQRTHFVDHTPLDVSSSGIREKITAGISITDRVPEEVVKVIEKEQLYS